MPAITSTPTTSLNDLPYASTYRPRLSGMDVRQLYEARLQTWGTDLHRMRYVQQVMDGEIALPLPEVNANEAPAVANLSLQGMGQLGRRIASLLPTVFFPPLRPNIKQSLARASDRRRVTLGWHGENRLRWLLGKRARFYLAYATSPVVILPETDQHADSPVPRWRYLNPLHTFPSDHDYDNLTPDDCIHDFTHSYKWLLDHYPEAAKELSKPLGWDLDNDVANWEVPFTILEYWDANEILLVAVGHNRHNEYVNHYSEVMTPTSTGNAVILEAAPNLTSICPVVTPGAINLSKPQGHFDQIIGMYAMEAGLMAMSYIAQRRSIWPREWLVGDRESTPKILSVPDPFSGTPGVLKGGALETQNLDPSFRALELMDRLEAAQRMTAGLPAEFGGASPTNIRTGVRGAQVMGSTIDFTIAEAQHLFADSIYEENRRAIAIDKAYFNTPKTYHIVTRGYQGQVTYTPSDLWETDKHIVDYPIAGTDMQNLPIEGGQRVAMGTLSRHTFMEMDPAVPDAEAELQRITQEGISTAFLTSIQTLAADPAGPYQPTDLARLNELVAGGAPLFDAVATLQREVQERQATMTQEPALAQPGLSLPGEGVEQPLDPAAAQANIPEPPADMGTLAQLLGQLGTVQTAQTYR